MGAAQGKFKVGDLVRAVQNDYAGGYKRGDEFTLKGVTSRGLLEIVDTDGDNRTRPTEDFELVAPRPAFKVGDRVRVVANTKGGGGLMSFVGREGVVESADVNACVILSCDGLGRFFNFDELELISAALTIQAGKFYMTRDGRKVGPMRDDWNIEKEFRYHTTTGLLTGHLWDAGGKNYNEPQTDLIAEWVDEPAATVATPVAEQPAANPKFKVGDRVNWTRVSGEFDGSTIIAIDVDTDFEVWPYKLRATNGSVTFAAEGELELVDRPKSFLDSLIGRTFTAKIVKPSTPAIVCLMENGRPLPAERPHVHPSTSAAEREAARLADKYKGKEFAVFELGSSCRKEPEYAHEWQRLAKEGQRVRAVVSLRRDNDFLSIRAAKLFVDDFMAAA